MNLTIKGDKQSIFDAQAMHDIQLDDNFPLPHSYMEFMQKYGFGRLLGLLMIYVPLENHSYSLLGHGAHVRKMIHEAANSDDMEYGRDGSRELALRLFPFAESENGEYFCWDLKKGRDLTFPSERMIYCVGARLGGVNHAADNIESLIISLCSPKIKKIMGPGYEPLLPDFQTLPLQAP